MQTKYLGTIPTDDIDLDDGRILALIYHSTGSYRHWRTLDGLEVIAHWEPLKNSANTFGPHIIITSNREQPSPEEVGFICKLIFGDLPLDDSRHPFTQVLAPTSFIFRVKTE